MTTSRAVRGLVVLGMLAVAGCTSGPPAEGPAQPHAHSSDGLADPDLDPDLQALLDDARDATAELADPTAAEAAGYASTIDTLGCFHDLVSGGMGVHYVAGDLMDAELDPTAPEALVFELDSSGTPGELVAHEYIVPTEAWTSQEAPMVFGQRLHQHPELPLWVLHAWVYRDNPEGVFADFNPEVARCPQGVPVFGLDPEEALVDRPGVPV